VKIAIDNYILADGINSRVLTSPSGLTISGSDIQQQVALLRDTAQHVIGRGNRSTSITFTVTRQHADLLASERFMLEHERDCPRNGLITLTVRGAGGFEISLYMADASLVPQSTYLGITTQHQYQIQGGELVSVRPTA
jgi:hypothetical protein